MLGTTYSTFHIKERGLDINNSFDRLLELNFDLVRIGTYWNQMEKNVAEYDFDLIHKLLEKAEIRNQNLILTVGAKSPRWPEFHIPTWALSECGLEKSHPLISVEKNILNLIEKTVNEFKSYKCIYIWQVENEPLDPSGPNNWSVSEDFLEIEVELVKSLDSRPVLVNLWGNELKKRKLFKKLPDKTDYIGLDLYYRVPGNFINRYTGPKDSDSNINKILESLNKPNIITELQAEPWENRRRSDTPSISPELLKSNYNRVKQSIETSGVLLWGYEFWYHELIKDNSSYWNTVKKLILENNKT